MDLPTWGDALTIGCGGTTGSATNVERRFAVLRSAVMRASSRLGPPRVTDRFR